jgi:hypothetical protein
VGRRRFDHLVLELSLILGRALPRYPLWLRLHEAGFDPEDLSRDELLAFCGPPLEHFLAERGLALRLHQRRRLARAIGRFDPSLPAPEEHLERLHGG